MVADRLNRRAIVITTGLVRVAILLFLTASILTHRVDILVVLAALFLFGVTGEHFPFGRRQIEIRRLVLRAGFQRLAVLGDGVEHLILLHWCRAWHWGKVQAKSIDTERSACFFYVSLLR